MMRSCRVTAWIPKQMFFYIGLSFLILELIAIVAHAAEMKTDNTLFSAFSSHASILKE